MSKIYQISESQYKHLIERKREENTTFKQICEELNRKRSLLKESKQLNEGIIDTIKDYLRRGALTVTVIASLLAAQQVDAQQLQQAGVPKAQIEMAMQKVKYDPSKMTTKQIEDRLIQIMKKNNLKGSLDSYNKLTPQQKDNILNGIKSQIKSLDDINRISIGNWEKYDREGAIKFDTQVESKIKAVSVDTVSTIPLTQEFKFNSFELKNPDSVKTTIKDLIKGYANIDSITIVSSSSTLRNKDEAEGLTWKELSQKRAEEVSKLFLGEKVDLGGGGKNVKKVISPDMISINSDGTNGDGTSGPKSPYEVNPTYIKSYNDRNIDPKFWKSDASEDALPEEQISQYKKYQYVIVKIYGKVIENETEEVPSYRYVLLTVQKAGGKIKKGEKREVADYSKCPVKIKS